MQRYLDGLRYNTERGGATVRSPRRVMRDRTAHCAEGAFLAAAAFRVHGRPPLVVDLEADRDDDHDLAVYRERREKEGLTEGATEVDFFRSLTD